MTFTRGEILHELADVLSSIRQSRDLAIERYSHREAAMIQTKIDKLQWGYDYMVDHLPQGDLTGPHN